MLDAETKAKIDSARDILVGKVPDPKSQVEQITHDHSERLGDAFEYLLSVLGTQGDAGQFRTPRHIIDFIVAVVDPQKHETVLDPACGNAGFLISAFKHILRNNENLLFLDRNLSRRTDELLFVKVESDGFDLGAQRRPNGKNGLPEALKAIVTWKNDRKVVEGTIALAVSRKRILESPDGGLSGDRYRPIAVRSNGEWAMVSIGEICELQNGRAFKPMDWEKAGSGGLPLAEQERLVVELEGYRKLIEAARQVLANYKPTIRIDPRWPTVELREVIQAKPKNGYSGKPVSYSTNLKILPLTAMTSGKLDITRFKFLSMKIFRRTHHADAGAATSIYSEETQRSWWARLLCLMWMMQTSSIQIS